MRSFVDAALAQMRHADMMRVPLPDMPDAMRDPDIPAQDDWVAWRAIPSTVTDAELDELEREISLQFPPVYRAFLKYQHFLELEGPVRFVTHPPGNWQRELRQVYKGWKPDRILRVGLIPFAEETLLDAGPICFDTRRRLPNGDCPVVLWDHEWLGTDREIQPVFSSGEAMFRCLEFTTRPGTDISKSRASFEAFLALDRTGAGASGRDYWSAWAPGGARRLPTVSFSPQQYVGAFIGVAGIVLALVASSIKQPLLLIAACAVMVVGVVLILRSKPA